MGVQVYIAKEMELGEQEHFEEQLHVGFKKMCQWSREVRVLDKDQKTRVQIPA